MNNLQITRILTACCLLLLIYLPFGCGLVTSLGQNPRGQALLYLNKQPNYVKGEFRNLPYTDDTIEVNRVGMLKQLFGKPDSISPPQPLPWIKTDLKALPGEKPVIVWFGHSSVLIKYKSTNILIDPIFSGNAGPIPFMIKAFDGAKHYKVEDMPPIDVVIISHDHYDHLDYPTLKKLRNKVKKIIVPLGVGSHLRYWGFKPEQIQELNWGQSFTLPGGTSISATPARHRSNRTLETGKTLWASYVIKTGDYRIFYSGDSGFGYHFKNIGAKYGPFDLAIMECGQYGPNWPHSHMLPEKTAQAAFDVKANVLLPVHWSKFAESSHEWNDPVRRLLPAARKLNIQVTIPKIGEPYVIGDPLLQQVWWEF